LALSMCVFYAHGPSATGIRTLADIGHLDQYHSEIVLFIL